MTTYASPSVRLSNAAKSDVSRRLKDATDGEGTLQRMANGSYVAAMPGTWLADAAEETWREVLLAWIREDGSAVGDWGVV